MQNSEKFGDRIRLLRKKLKLTQLELALLIKTEKRPDGLPKSTLAGYENNIRKPKFETLEKLAEVLNTSTDYLVGMTDDPQPTKPSKDLRKLLQSRDYHIDGKKLSNDDLEFAIKFLEKLAKDEDNTEFSNELMNLKSID